MRLSRTSLQKAVTGVALGTGLAVATSANAGIVFDVRFTDGTNTKTISSTGTYALQVWVRVIGTNANNQDEGVASGYMNIRSQQVSGGAMVGAGDGLRNPDPTDLGTSPPAGNPAGTYSYGTRTYPFSDNGTSRDGTGSDLNADGVVDWGGNATAIENTDYMVWRSVSVPAEWGGNRKGGSPKHSDGQVSANGGWEWEIGQFNVVISSLGTGRTIFKVAAPVGRVTTGTTNWVNAIIDNVATSADSNSDLGVWTTDDTNKVATHDATFVVPEPASLGLLAAAAVGLLGRKRRK